MIREAVLLAALAGAARAEEETPGPLPRAERLAGEFGCTACHAADAATLDRLATAAAPRLDRAAARLNPSYLRRFLADPFGTEPHNRMPDLLAKLDGSDREHALERLVHFLATLGDPPEPGAAGVLVSSLERGRRLFHERGCVACHLPQETPWQLDEPLAQRLADGLGLLAEDEEDDEGPPYLPPGTLAHPALALDPGWLGAKTRLPALAAFLEDPLAVRPAGRMPDLHLDEQEARDLAAYLLRGQVDVEAGATAPVAGLAYELFEESTVESLSELAGRVPVDHGEVPRFTIDVPRPDDHFALRYTGELDVPAAGAWTFHLSSDDGSHLWVDGEHVIDHGGVHGTTTRSATVDLEAGVHAVEVTMFEYEGGEALRLEWEGPGVEREEVPPEALSHRGLALRAPDAGFAPDPRLAREGARLFEGLGCVACHATGRPEIDDAPRIGAAAGPALDVLDPAVASGCLTPGPGKGGVRYPLPEADRRALLELLGERGGLRATLPPEQAVARALDRLHCYACHRRDGLGGVHPSVRPYFRSNDDAELGDEGRFPPLLTLVGAKLRNEALHAALLEGRVVRPYLATRMPRFGGENVEPLLELLPRADPPSGESGPPADAAILQAGHQLAGTGGLGCIQCHTFDGVPSLGVQAVDLTTMHERLRYGWFRDLMLDPIAIDMNTRMPVFWMDGESPCELLDRDPVRQTDALWAYLAQGSSMPWPAGLATSDAAYELVPTGEPIVCGVFLRGVSPRVLVVGHPELVHYAFDMQDPRLALVWRGRFFNARGTWEGRAGQLEWAASEDVLELPSGPTLARLSDPAAPWPEAGAQWLGRCYDGARRPVQRYRVAGVTVEERLLPVLDGPRAGLRRELVVRSPTPVRDLWMRAGAWPAADAEPSMDVRLRGTGPPLRLVGEGVELRVPVDLAPARGGGYEARFAVEVDW